MSRLPSKKDSLEILVTGSEKLDRILGSVQLWTQSFVKTFLRSINKQNSHSI